MGTICFETPEVARKCLKCNKWYPAHLLYVFYVSHIVHHTLFSLLQTKLWPKCKNTSSALLLLLKRRFEHWSHKQPWFSALHIQWAAVQPWVVKHDGSEMNRVPVHFVNGHLLHHVTQWWQCTGTHSVKCSVSTVGFLIGEQEGCLDFGLKPKIPSLMSQWMHT